MVESRKRRASKACSSCRARKVKCNVLQSGPPCSKCREDGFDCCVKERKKRRTKAPVASHPRSHAGVYGNLHHSPRGESPRADSKFTSLPPHVASHQIPHYPFFRDLPQKANPERPPSEHADIDSPKVQMIPHNGQASDLSVEDFQFLKQKGAFELPSRPLLDELVFNYFEVFHPFFPVVDKPAFLNEYESLEKTDSQSPSLLLLQAIIFTSCAVSPL